MTVRAPRPPGRGARDLGLPPRAPIMGGMEIISDNPDHGYQFPGVFELSAMGTAGVGLETELLALLERGGITVVHEQVSWKHSSNGRYVAVRIAFHAASRAEFDSVHQALRSHPHVKWTL